MLAPGTTAGRRERTPRVTRHCFGARGPTETNFVARRVGSFRTYLFNRLFDSFFADDRSVRSVELSDWRLQIIRQKIESSAKTIEMKEQKRNRALEDGELAVLRTIDATEGGFTDQIVQTSRDSLALIRSTRASIEALLAANARSRAASADITNSIQDTAGGEAILKGALQVVAKGAHIDGQSLETDIERLAIEKTAAAGDDAQAALITVNMDKASKNAQEALSYEQTIKAKVVSFEMLASTHIQEEARAKQFSALVENSP